MPDPESLTFSFPPYRVEATKTGYQVFNRDMLHADDGLVASVETQLQRGVLWLMNEGRIPNDGQVADEL